MVPLLPWILAASLSLAAQTPSPPDLLRNSRGEVLKTPRVLKFDGYKFDVEHAEGITTIPWEKMPASWRAKFNRAEAIEAHGRALDSERSRLQSQLTHRRAEPQPEVLVAGTIRGSPADPKFWIVAPQRASVAYRNGTPLSKGEKDQLPLAVPSKGHAVFVPAEEVPSAWQRGAFVVFKATVYETSFSRRTPGGIEVFVTAIKPWDHPLIVISPVPTP